MHVVGGAAATWAATRSGAGHDDELFAEGDRGPRVRRKMGGLVWFPVESDQRNSQGNLGLVTQFANLVLYTGQLVEMISIVAPAGSICIEDLRYNDYIQKTCCSQSNDNLWIINTVFDCCRFCEVNYYENTWGVDGIMVASLGCICRDLCHLGSKMLSCILLDKYSWLESSRSFHLFAAVGHYTTESLRPHSRGVDGEMHPISYILFWAPLRGGRVGIRWKNQQRESHQMPADIEGALSWFGPQTQNAMQHGVGIQSLHGANEPERRGYPSVS